MISHHVFTYIFCLLKQKIEVIDEDEDDSEDYNGELVSSDIEQMQSLLEFKVKRLNFYSDKLFKLQI